ncbi:MAG: hypothetical protein J6U34_04045 [Bacteroidales bacterium]|nr:hypothetical protein [Bacteroidales bacterium]
MPESRPQAAGGLISIHRRFPFCEHGSSWVTCPVIIRPGNRTPRLPSGIDKSLIMKSFFLTPEQYSDLKRRYAKFNEPWTEKEAEELKQMAIDGVARAEMSAQLGRTPGAIKMKLQSLGLYVPKPATRPWTPEDEHSLIKLYRDGVSFAELAAVFGRTEGAILRRLIRLRAAVLPDIAPAAEAPAEA